MGGNVGDEEEIVDITRLTLSGQALTDRVLMCPTLRYPTLKVFVSCEHGTVW